MVTSTLEYVFEIKGKLELCCYKHSYTYCMHWWVYAAAAGAAAAAAAAAAVICLYFRHIDLPLSGLDGTSVFKFYLIFLCFAIWRC